MNEQVRLFLQSCLDNEGTEAAGSYPSVLYDASAAAVEAELAEWGARLTDGGRKALAEANAALGDRATRYVHGTRFFPGVGETPYDAPFVVPLSAPTKRVMGCLCESETANAFMSHLQNALNI